MIPKGIIWVHKGFCVNKMRKIASVVILAVVMMVSAFAQDEGVYRLQPEDIIRIQIYNEQQVSAEVQVGRDGNISAPFIGTIRAEGKTTALLEADLALEYTKKLRLRDPRVSVIIIRFRQLFATVVGAVNRPGKFEIRQGDTIKSLIGNGGGVFTEGRAELRRATLQRAGSKELIPVDLYSLIVKGDLTQDYELFDGDIFTVPEDTRNRVMVLGAVQSPGQYPFRDQMTLADAISLARGDIQFRSKMSETLVIREKPGLPGEYDRIKANYVNFISKGDSSQNIVLRPGDIVFIPDTKTPSGGRIGEIAQAAANALFILDRFGINIFGR